MWTQKPCSWDGMGWEALESRGLREIPPKLAVAATNPKHLMLRYFSGNQKNVVSTFSVEPFQNHNSNVLFLGEKYWKIAFDFLAFAQQPRVTSVIVATIKIWKMTLFLTHARCIIRRPAASRLFVRAVLTWRNANEFLSHRKKMNLASVDWAIIFSSMLSFIRTSLCEKKPRMQIWQALLKIRWKNGESWLSLWRLKLFFCQCENIPMQSAIV